MGVGKVIFTCHLCIVLYCILSNESNAKGIKGIWRVIGASPTAPQSLFFPASPRDWPIGCGVFSTGHKPRSQPRQGLSA